VKNKRVRSALLILCLFVCTTFVGTEANAFDIGGPGALNAGAAVFLTSHTFGYIASVGFEKRITRVFALYANAGRIDYRFETDRYRETGAGPGFELGMLLYPFRREDMKDCYLGMGIGHWWVKSIWQDDLGTPFVTGGGLRSSIDSVRLQTGYKWYLGLNNNIALDLRLQFGEMISDINSQAFDVRGFVGLYLAVGMLW
jgi:hypothetical protein